MSVQSTVVLFLQIARKFYLNICYCFFPGKIMIWSKVKFFSYVEHKSLKDIEQNYSYMWESWGRGVSAWLVGLKCLGVMAVHMHQSENINLILFLLKKTVKWMLFDAQNLLAWKENMEKINLIQYLILRKKYMQPCR